MSEYLSCISLKYSYYLSFSVEAWRGSSSTILDPVTRAGRGIFRLYSSPFVRESCPSLTKELPMKGTHLILAKFIFLMSVENF